VPTEHRFWVSPIGGILLGIGLVELVFKLFVEKDLIDKISQQICYDINRPLEDFYQDRDELTSFKDALEGCSEVWVAWHTGGIVGSRGDIKYLKSEKIKDVRIILTHPESKSLDASAEVGEIRKELENQIKTCTEAAQKYGLPVKWYKGPIRHSVIIGDPNSNKNKGWARIELIIPFQETLARPNIKISQCKGKETFEKVKQWHEVMWERAEEPSIPKTKNRINS